MLTLSRKLRILPVMLLTLIGGSILMPPQAEALSGSDFQAGHIIDDSVFTNANTMSVSDIQNFLNAKIPSCDTYGTKNSTRWNSSAGRYYTRAEWGSLSGNPAPYTCLRDYVENTTTLQNNYKSPGTAVPGGISAAQIIWNASKAHQINPQVLLTTLQKEQGLVTDDWPWYDSYKSAMGYGCPDTAACDTRYYGFYNQVENAAWQFRRYLGNLNQYNYGLGANYIQYNPVASCGGTTVTIQNAATAALYIYTPYQPNASSLSNLVGSGDSCGAYGNRNFWRYFNEWFGSTLEPTDSTDTPTAQNRVTTLEHNGQIYVFYYDAFQRVLRVGTQNLSTGRWEFSILDGSSTAGGGRIDASLGSSVAATVYGGTMQLFYYDKSHGNLRHAWKDGSGWHFETLDGDAGSVSRLNSDTGMNPSITITPDNSLQVYYHDRSYGVLRHAWTNATGWNFENLDGDIGSISKRSGNVGLMSTVTMLGNSIQLYYYDKSHGNLRHAWTTDTGWRFENLDGDAGSVGRLTGDIGMSPTILNYGGSLQLYYYDKDHGNLRHAWTTSTGWQFENLDGDPGSVGRHNSNVGLSPALTTYGGSLQLYYYDKDHGNLRHAWTTSTGWQFENLDGDPGSVGRTNGDIGFNPSATTYQSSLQLYYLDKSRGTLRHAWADATGWHFEDLASVVIY